jgi:hypothetical protein
MQRKLDAVRFPQFTTNAPQVVMEHLIISGSNIVAWQAGLSLSLPDANYVRDTPMIHDPSQVVVYQRPTPGTGPFSALATTYDSGTQKLLVTTTQMGEFIFAYPDQAQTPYMPAMLSPADQSQVNQSQAVTLVWKPQGLVGSFEVQVATNADFANPVIATNSLGTASFALQNPTPNTQLFWRVRTVNQGGASGWATASFFAVPPTLQITSPAGGEVWQRFQVVTILWNDNISENVALDLYLDGVSNRTFSASTASSGAFNWTVAQFATITPGTNYTVKIRSTTNPSLFDFSERFTIITNLTRVTFGTLPTNLSIMVDGTNYTATTNFNWLPFSPHSIGTASPQVASNGRSQSVFAAWSDGGAQSHSITVPFSAATNMASFSTNYLLEISTNLAGAGAVSTVPAGPWFDTGQVVSLSATPNAGYLFYTWQGVDSQANNTAQLAMTGYRAAQAQFFPESGVPAIDAASFIRLADGRAQFNLTAGAGVATQATVWAATTLRPPDWQVLGTAPLTNGSGMFIENAAPTGSTRFYRVSLP